MGMFGGKNLGDIIYMIGAGLKDASPGSPGGNLAEAQQMMMQRQQRAQQMAFIQSLLNPSQGAPGPASPGQAAPGGAPAASPGVGGFSLQNPDLAKQALIGKLLGVDVSPGIDVLKAQQPDVNYVNGFRYDKKNPASGPAFAPTLDKGQEPLFDANGRIAGIRNIDGSVKAAADMAGAVGAAQEGAKAALDLVDVPRPDGSTIKLPRDLAVKLLGGSVPGAGAPSIGAPAPTPGGAGAAAAPAGAPSPLAGLGTTQTPAAKILAEGAAKTQVDRTALLPKQNSMLSELDNRSALTSQIIHQILGDAPITDKDGNPTGQYRKGGADPMIRWYTTGFGANLAPINGTPQHDLAAQIDHVRAMTALDELQKLRDDSPTGAGLGRVTQQEINLLAAMRGSIDQGQSGAQLAQNLRRQLGQLDQIRANRHQQYQETYGDQQGGSPPAKPAGAPRAPTMSGRGYKIISVQ